MSDFAKPLSKLTTLAVTAAPAAGQGVALTATGWVPVAARHPGQELYYEEKASATSIGATSEATATTVVAGSSLFYDGKPVLIEFFAPVYNKGTTSITVVLYDDPGTGTAASIGKLVDAATGTNFPLGVLARRLSPTQGFHTYSVRAYVDAGLGGAVNGSSGGSGNRMPAFLRISRAAGGND